MRDDPCQAVRARLGSYRSRVACIPTVAAAVLLATGIVPASAAAVEVAATPAPALVVDQQQPGLELTAARLAITSAAHSEQKLAQTFTVGRSGQLRRIDLPVACAPRGSCGSRSRGWPAASRAALR